jgi:hypothetical protein
MHEEDLKQLRSTLGSHVATINLLLMTQTIGSIAAAENDRESFAFSLQAKILAHRRLIEDVKTRVELNLERQLETKLQLSIPGLPSFHRWCGTSEWRSDMPRLRKVGRLNPPTIAKFAWPRDY